MFDKILVANRGDNVRAARVAAKPDCMVREAHEGGFAAETQHV